MDSNERLRDAFDGIKRWMKAHRAPLIVANLAEGASAARLDEAEAAFGFPIPAELRQLWALHDGQKGELNGFIGSLDLLGTHRSVGERDRVVRSVEFLRESPHAWDEAGVTTDEVMSNRWLPLGGRDHDFLIVSGESGRVFTCEKGAPPLRRVAESVTQWADACAARVVADDYVVVKGFGDYYLQKRDREAEDSARRFKEEEQRRRKTPLLEQLQEAVARRDGERCRDILERAGKKPKVLADAIAVLFGAADPGLIATALRSLLNAATLTPDQWVDVAEGGSLIENNAVRDVAVGRSPGRSAGRVAKLEASVERAEPHQRKHLEAVLEQVRAKG